MSFAQVVRFGFGAIDIFLRPFALALAVLFFIQFERFGKVAPLGGALILAHVALMLACLLSPFRRVPFMLVPLGVFLLPAAVDAHMHWAKTGAEQAMSLYLGELVIAMWFVFKHSYKGSWN